MYRLPFPPVVSKLQSPSPTYREGRKGQLGASGLVANAVGLWTSFYPDRVVKHLREQCGGVRRGNLARVSPLARRGRPLTVYMRENRYVPAKIQTESA